MIIILWMCNIGEAEWSVYRNTLCYFCNSSVSLKLFQTKSFFLNNENGSRHYEMSTVVIVEQIKYATPNGTIPFARISYICTYQSSSQISYYVIWFICGRKMMRGTVTFLFMESNFAILCCSMITYLFYVCFWIYTYT